MFSTGWKFGSPPWTRFELLRPRTPPARTRRTALFTRGSEQKAAVHPGWAPSLDTFRIRQSNFRMSHNRTERLCAAIPQHQILLPAGSILLGAAPRPLDTTRLLDLVRRSRLSSSATERCDRRTHGS